MELIHSRQNAAIKDCVRLSTQRRERMSSRRTVLDGAHLIKAALDAGRPPERLLVAQSRTGDAEIADILAQCQGVASLVDDTLFAAITPLESPTGLLAIWPLPDEPILRRDGCILALDAVQDPGNVGTMLRTAAAADVDQVWLGSGCADAWSPKAMRAGMGAHFVLPVAERVALEDALPAFGGRRLVTALGAPRQDLYDIDLRGDIVLLLGSEGQGVAPNLMAMADQCVAIPMRPGIESLNVSAAAAICLYERVRQQRGR